jgi:replicative DNA helicase
MKQLSTLTLDQNLFEKVMIYNALMDPIYLQGIIEHIRPTYFKDEKIKVVFDSLAEYFKHHQKVPNITELKLYLLETEKRQALRDVVLSFNDIDKTYDKDTLLSNTERFLKEKAVYHTVLKTSVEVQSGQFNISQILKSFEEACGISLLENNGFDYLENIDQHCEELQKVFQTIPSGWKWLDEKIGGGFQSAGRALYVFYGVTNVGKSIFLGNIATNILSQDKTVVLISMEMSEQVYAKRISSQLSKIPMDDLSAQITPLKNHLGAYKLNHRNAKLIIKEFPPKSISPLQIKTYIDRLARKGIKPDAIVLDYLNLIGPTEKGLNSYESVKQITEAVRAMSYHFECPVITATQTNRSAYNEANPGLETTSESMGLSHTADAQFSIWTEEEDFELGIIHLGITKNRFGPRDCHTVLQIDYPTLSLSDPDSVSKNFVVQRKHIPGSDKGSNNSITDTLIRMESLGEEVD